MEPSTRIFCVLGYGVPVDILQDANSFRYLSSALRHAMGVRQPACVYLVGGATDPRRPRLTEAGEMERLAQFLLAFWKQAVGRARFVRLESATDVLGNLKELAGRVGRDADVTIFCEYARQDRVRFLARFLLPLARVRPIAFDGNMGHPLVARLRQLPNTLVVVVGFLSPTFKRLVTDPLRRRHMARESVRRRAAP